MGKVFGILKFLPHLIILCLTLLFHGCSDEYSSSSQKRVAIRLGLAMQPSSSLVMVALEKSFFAQEGLDISVSEFPSGKRALLDGLLPGNVDLATSTEIPVMMASLDNEDIKILATTFSANNVNRIVVRRDSGISNPTDLSGKRIATQKASAVHFFLHLFLVNLGISENNTDMSFMKAEALPKAIFDGKIDAFSMREPFITQARRLLGDKIMVFEAPGLYNQVDMIVASGSLLRDQPDVSFQLIRALIRAEDYINKKPDEAKTIASNRLKVSKEKIQSLWPSIKLQVALAHSSLLLMESEARWAIEQGLTNVTAMPNFLDFFHLEGLARLNPDAVSIIR